MMGHVARLGAVAGVGTAALLLGSCATMSKDQCLAGAWGEVGFADGAEGYPMSRLDEHVQACAKYGVAPNPAAYASAREDGLRRYCTPARGFQEGRQGDVYHGVCPPAQEARFLPAYRDGQVVHEAESMVEEASSRISSLNGRIRDADDKLEAKERDLRAEGLSEDEKRAIRDRIAEVRNDRRNAERDLRDARRDLDEAEREARQVRLHFVGLYGPW